MSRMTARSVEQCHLEALVENARRDVRGTPFGTREWRLEYSQRVKRLDKALDALDAFYRAA